MHFNAVQPYSGQGAVENVFKFQIEEILLLFQSFDG